MSGWVLVAALWGCGGGERRELVVLAAASLTEAFGALGDAFEAAHPDTRVLLSFAGSQTLATQLREGIAADVIATASAAIMRGLEADGLVAQPRPFASNRLVWIASRASLPGEADAELLAAALERESWRLVLAAPEVPAGGYAREALARLELLELAKTRTVSQELDVKSVVAKVRLAGADAGMVYATDVTRELRPRLHVVELPERGQVRAIYLAARAARSPDPGAAEGFLAFLHSRTGGRILADRGFGAP